MGGHKKSPVKEDMEPVTPLFIAQAKAQMAINAAYNEQHHLKKGMKGYRIVTPADLHEESGVDPNQIKNMFGGVRPGTITKKIGRSRDVPRIRRALGLPRMVSIEVPKDRAEFLRRIANLPGDRFVKLEEEFARISVE